MKRICMLFIILPALVLGEITGGDNAMKMAQQYYREGSYEKALDSYKTALETGENRALVYFNMGNLYYLLEKPWLSVTCYKKVIHLVPDFMPSYLNLAKIFFRYQDFPETISVCRKALERKKDHECLLVMGAAYLELEMPADAVRCFTEAKNINPVNERSYFYCSRAYLSIDDLPSAIKEIEEALAMSKKPETVRPYLAELYYRAGEYKKAASLYETITIDSGKNRQPWLRLAECYKKLDMPFLAIDTLEQLRDSHPGDSQIVTSLGTTYLELSMYEQGENILIQALSLDGFSVRREIKNLAIIYHNSGKSERLRSLLDKISKRKPSLASEIRELLSE